MSRRLQMRLVAITVVLGSLGIGTAAIAVGPFFFNDTATTEIYTPCPHTGYTSRPCSHK